MKFYPADTHKEALRAALQDDGREWTDEEKEALEGVVNDDNNLGIPVSFGDRFWNLEGTKIVFRTANSLCGYSVTRVTAESMRRRHSIGTHRR